MIRRLFSFKPTVQANLASQRRQPPAGARLAAAGFTLLELLMVVAVVAILTAVVMPWTQSTSHETLEAAARAVATDLAYARSLSVTNNSNYVVNFDVAGNRYVLEHSGANETLDTLPDSVFRSVDDPPDQHIVKLNELPGIGDPVELVGAYRIDGGVSDITDVEFGPLGETTETGYTVLVLKLKVDGSDRFAVVVVNPVTGLATVHPEGRDLPSTVSATDVENILKSL
jgi:prepilin-type N-terminal cleavage/methylation domain-containing protein